MKTKAITCSLKKFLSFLQTHSIDLMKHPQVSQWWCKDNGGWSGWIIMADSNSMVESENYS